ncbi:MAG: hypothetical protein HGB02_09605 [Chlorobiaceae bacterium]|nr:hypothetical protein [Chlorobiaceae bacterium]
MGLKWLFTTMFSVLVQPQAFWKEGAGRREGVNAMKDYAAPVIAMVQLLKLPLVGVPKPAMIMAIISFIVDVAVLYLLSGAIASIAGRDRTASMQDDILAMLCYALTPVWLAEPFYFANAWRWLFLVVALVHACFILKPGLHATLDMATPHVEALTGKSALLTSAATLASFMAMTGLIRIFTSF